MKTIFVFLLFIGLSVYISCCSKLFPDEKLTIQRADYTGNELKIDGYYYYQEITEKYSNTIVMVLYRNGIVLSCGSFSTTDLNVVEEDMPKRYNLLKKHKIGWGVFLITDNQISIERWNASTGFSLPIAICKGYIENDSTFHITETYFSDSEKTNYGETVYHFKQFANKPDSTNNYIK